MPRLIVLAVNVSKKRCISYLVRDIRHCFFGLCLLHISILMGCRKHFGTCFGELYGAYTYKYCFFGLCLLHISILMGCRKHFGTCFGELYGAYTYKYIYTSFSAGKKHQYINLYEKGHYVCDVPSIATLCYYIPRTQLTVFGAG